MKPIDIKPDNLLTAGIVAVVAVTVGYFARPKPVEASPECDPHRVAEHILVAQRPQMGELERKFWIDVLVKHYEARGLSVALGASLLAQENHFKTYRVSSTGAQGAFQIMPAWKGTPECPKDADLFEVEVAAECSARIMAKNLERCRGEVDCALRNYVSSPRNEAKHQWYADQIITRLARATSKCPAFKPLLLINQEGQS